jgi:ATP-binding cassette subfamily G (WHITE) protein 1
MGGSYRYSSYYVARVIAELPFQLVFAVVYSIIIYWSTGLNPHVENSFIFIAIIALTTLNACALGFIISAISPDAAIANAIGPPIFIILLLYGGFYINASSLPVGSVWVRNLSLVYWGFQALIITEFQGETFSCSDAIGGQCTTTGAEVIASLSFQVSEWVLDVDCMSH